MMKKHLLILLLVALSLDGVYANTNPTPYTIDGDEVYIDDDYVRISQTPHTLREDGKAIVHITSKTYEGNVDLVFGFNTTLIQPSNARVYNPRWIQVGHEYTCLYEYNYTVDPKYLWCYYNITRNIGSNSSPVWMNSTVVVWEGEFDSSDLDSKTVYWNELVWRNYYDFSDRFTKVGYDYGGMDTWYHSQSLWVQQGSEYELEFNVNYLHMGGEFSGKYWMCLKPSHKSIATAKADGELYCLDPWWNTSLPFRYPITNTSILNSDIPYSVNDNLTVDGSVLWTRFNATCVDQQFVYSSESGPSGILAVANDSIECNWENASSLTGNSPTGVYPSDIVVWLHFDDGTDANDSSQADNDGTQSNLASTTGKIGSALDYDSSSDVVTVPDDASLDVAAGESFTWAVWINTTSTARFATIFRKNPGAGAAYFMRLTQTTGRSHGRVVDADSDTQVDGTTNLADGDWHLLAMVLNRGDDTLKMYEDGDEVDSADASGEGSLENGDDLTIGRSSGGEFFTGVIDEVAIWERALNETEIRQLYWNGIDNLTSLGSEEGFSVPWNYSLDGAANVSFFPNITLTGLVRGPHTLTIFSNVSNETVIIDSPLNTTVFSTSVALNVTSNATLGTGSATVAFSAAGIHIQVRDLETENNVTSGINTRILNTDETINSSNSTNASGANLYTGIPFGVFKVQAGGPAGSPYPHIFTYTFNFSHAITNLDVFLPEATSCQFVTYQYVDSFFQTPLSNVSVTFYRATNILTEDSTDTNGFVTICLVPGLLYTLESIVGGYQTTNFTDRATLSSQFVQMIRNELSTVTETSITLNPYPLETTFFINDTLFLGMFISDTENQLTDYGVIYGRSEDVIRDDSVDSDQPLFKLEVAEGNLPGGEFIDCLPDNCLDVAEWEDSRVFVGYHYTRSGSSRVWLIREIRIDRRSPQAENFFTTYLFEHNPRDALFAFFASIGYPRDADRPSLGMVTFSLFVMAASAGSAAKRGGVLFAMIALMVSNVILALMGLIQWWSLIISISLIGYLANKFGGQFT